ncbi:hypothetical protein J6590_029518 [Homalodisca vitripennis]|nr:hypothetical protein J6590_029518 [Homalodisca vitripennis]
MDDRVDRWTYFLLDVPREQADNTMCLSVCYRVARLWTTVWADGHIFYWTFLVNRLERTLSPEARRWDWIELETYETVQSTTTNRLDTIQVLNPQVYGVHTRGYMRFNIPAPAHRFPVHYRSSFCVIGTCTATSMFAAV